MPDEKVERIVVPGTAKEQGEGPGENVKATVKESDKGDELYGKLESY